MENNPKGDPNAPQQARMAEPSSNLLDGYNMVVNTMQEIDAKKISDDFRSCFLLFQQPVERVDNTTNPRHVRDCWSLFADVAGFFSRLQRQGKLSKLWRKGENTSTEKRLIGEINRLNSELQLNLIESI